MHKRPQNATVGKFLSEAYKLMLKYLGFVMHVQFVAAAFGHKFLNVLPNLVELLLSFYKIAVGAHAVAVCLRRDMADLKISGRAKSFKSAISRRGPRKSPKWLDKSCSGWSI